MRAAGCSAHITGEQGSRSGRPGPLPPGPSALRESAIGPGSRRFGLTLAHAPLRSNHPSHITGEQCRSLRPQRPSSSHPRGSSRALVPRFRQNPLGSGSLAASTCAPNPARLRRRFGTAPLRLADTFAGSVTASLVSLQPRVQWSSPPHFVRLKFPTRPSRSFPDLLSFPLRHPAPECSSVPLSQEGAGASSFQSVPPRERTLPCKARGRSLRTTQLPLRTLPQALRQRAGSRSSPRAYAPSLPSVAVLRIRRIDLRSCSASLD